MTQEEIMYIESSQRQHNECMLFEQKKCDEYERHCCDIVNTLVLIPYIDGSEYCVLWGDDLQKGIAGFGGTPMLAIVDFYESLQKSLKKEKAEE